MRKFERRYLCDAETVNSDKWGFAEASGQPVFFQNVDTRSNELAFNGEFSSKLTVEKPYGMTIEIDDILPDDYIQVNVWRKSSKGDGVLVIDGGEGFYDASKEIIETAQNGWQKLQLNYFIPPNYTGKTIKIYTWNQGQDTVFFDDFEIIHRRSKNYPEFDNIPGLRLFTNESDLEKLNKKRKFAFENGALINSDEDYSKVILYDGNDFLNGKFRLKGDLVDHLQGDKWSFRIKLKKGFAWRNMVTFSIHSPVTRNFLSEWLSHQVFIKEDVLTTRYGFVPITLNGKSLGLYAWEEHFEKQLLESKNRMEGPILKFDESLFWARLVQTNLTKRQWDINFFDASKILPFKQNKTVADTLLYTQLVEGQKLVQQYRNFSLPVNKIFNIDKLARYYALVDITKAYHGFTWHNQRFYYNPITCLLEPIAFDCYIEGGVYQRIDEPVLGLLDPSKLHGFLKEELMLFQVFEDKGFNRKYINYLKIYSNENFISGIMAGLYPEIDSISELLRVEFPAYHFNTDFLMDNASFIRKNLKEIENNISRLGEEFQVVKHKKFRIDYTQDINPELIIKQVHANYDSRSGKLQLSNFHNGRVIVTGAISKSRSLTGFEKKVILPPYKGSSQPGVIMLQDFIPEMVIFSVGRREFITKVDPWPVPEGFTSRQLCIGSFDISSLPVVGDSIIFDGKYQYSSDVVIPDSFHVVMKPGTQFDLINNASFISFAPVKVLGETERPVNIFSSDKSSQGFHILQANERSVLQYVHFSGLSNLKRGGWRTTSAVTFYESDVDLYNCVFRANIACDDALNVARSDFFVENCRFENTFADAFDSDFSTGTVHKCRFKNIGNDAVDFSGSNVVIKDCFMEGIGDKAISGGEHSTLKVTDCEIYKTNIGIASKDLSEITLNKIIIEEAVYGMVAFIKKPEYGPAIIKIDNLKLKNSVVFHKIEKKSVLIVNGKIINGTEKNLAQKLYQ
ncbi:MAG: hypothetical protein GXO81_00300 [Chlorobi bacterium]|nr:hypothetical protein [Chlorobiota bacterium]